MTTPDIWFRAWEAISDDGEQAEEFPRPLLAHYCSIAVAEKILCGQELWLSNPLFMNDLEEVRFGVLTGRDVALSEPSLADALGTEDRQAAFLRALEVAFEKFNQQDAFDCYIACFSHHDPQDDDGLLSMWRAYGANGDGAAIVFDVNSVSDESTEISGLSLGKVVYGTAAQRRDWLRQLVQKLARFIHDAQPDSDELGLVAEALVERIKLMALFSKHTGFKEEREWRLLYVRHHDKSKLLESYLHYFVGDRGIEPKLKLPLVGDVFRNGTTLSMGALVDRVLLGPCVSSPLAKMSFNRMLEVREQASLASKVQTSSIPLRPALHRR